jgi:hypothetical protein
MISTAIMAHPSRRALVARKRPLLPDAPIVWDEGEGEWATGRRALLSYDPRAEYHAVIQDDAILPARFMEALELVVSHAHGHPVGLYLGRCRPAGRLMVKVIRAAHEAGATWVEMAGGPWWGVGMALPTPTIPGMVAAADLFTHPLYDARIKVAYKRAGVWARYPVPSLLDHDPELPSLLDAQGGDRRAHDFIGSRDPRSFDWSGPVVRVDLRGRVSVCGRG